MSAKVYPHEVQSWVYVALIGMAVALTSLTRAMAHAKSSGTPPREISSPAACLLHGAFAEPAGKPACEPLQGPSAADGLSELIGHAGAVSARSERNRGKSPPGVLNPVQP